MCSKLNRILVQIFTNLFCILFFEKKRLLSVCPSVRVLVTFLVLKPLNSFNSFNPIISINSFNSFNPIIPFNPFNPFNLFNLFNLFIPINLLIHVIFWNLLKCNKRFDKVGNVGLSQTRWGAKPLWCPQGLGKNVGFPPFFSSLPNFFILYCQGLGLQCCQCWLWAQFCIHRDWHAAVQVSNGIKYYFQWGFWKLFNCQFISAIFINVLWWPPQGAWEWCQGGED